MCMEHGDAVYGEGLALFCVLNFTTEWCDVYLTEIKKNSKLE